VISDRLGQDVKYDRDITLHPQPFHGTNSHEAEKKVLTKWEQTKRKRLKDSVIIVAERFSVTVDEDSCSNTLKRCHKSWANLKNT